MACHLLLAINYVMHSKTGDVKYRVNVSSLFHTDNSVYNIHCACVSL